MNGLARTMAVMVAALVAASLALGPAWALSAEDVLKLKKAGVSDETIQKMIEAESLGGGQDSAGPVTETRDQVIYQAGEDAPAKNAANQAHERWKEKKALDAVGNVVIDQRQQ